MALSGAASDPFAPDDLLDAIDLAPRPACDGGGTGLFHQPGIFNAVWG